MTTTRFVVFAGLLLLLSGCSGDGEPTSVFPAEAGNRVILVNYWAEWCKPCREEIPELNAFARENAGEVVLYGVNFDGATGESLQSQEAALGIAFDTLPSDPALTLDWPRPEGLPQTVVTNRDGKKRLMLSGTQTRESLNRAIADFRKMPEGST